MENSASKALKCIIALSFLVSGCVSDSVRRERILRDNPGCWFDKEDALICPTPFEKEIQDEAGKLVQ